MYVSPYRLLYNVQVNHIVLTFQHWQTDKVSLSLCMGLGISLDLQTFTIRGQLKLCKYLGIAATLDLRFMVGHGKQISGITVQGGQVSGSICPGWGTNTLITSPSSAVYICPRTNILRASFTCMWHLASHDSYWIVCKIRRARVKGRQSNLWSRYDLCVVQQHGKLCVVKWWRFVTYWNETESA